MPDSAQSKAVKNYRKRLTRRGIARFEVLGLEADRPLIRSLAKKLAKNDAEARRLRSAVSGTLGGDGAKTGGVFAALRRSPLVGADLNIARARSAGRKVEL